VTDATTLLQSEAKRYVGIVGADAAKRAALASRELFNSSQRVLDGKRSGRFYYIPGGFGRKYQASAPGEPPARRTGRLRRSWRPEVLADTTSGSHKVFATVKSGVEYIPFLDPNLNRREAGGGMLTPNYRHSKMRPIAEPILRDAMPRVVKIFGRIRGRA